MDIFRWCLCDMTDCQLQYRWRVRDVGGRARVTFRKRSVSQRAAPTKQAEGNCSRRCLIMRYRTRYRIGILHFSSQP